MNPPAEAVGLRCQPSGQIRLPLTTVDRSGPGPRGDSRPRPIGECNHACGQQQHHPTAEKEPGGIDQVGINKVNIHVQPLAEPSTLPISFFARPFLAHPVAQLRFTGELFVFVQNVANGIEPAERGQMCVGDRLLNLRQPAFNGSLHADRHFMGDNIYQIRWQSGSGQERTRLSSIRGKQHSRGRNP
jgi:hypothetical protein